MTATEQLTQDHVAFESKFFNALDDAYFFKDDLSGDCLVSMAIDDKRANVKLNTLRSELKLMEAALDAVSLHVVVRSLDFVRALRVGDPVPSELKSGHASWNVLDKHRKVAEVRLSMQLVSWMSGDEEVLNDRTQLQMVADDPAMKSKINDAFSEAAEKLGFESENREAVVDLIGNLTEELAYIEVL